MCVVTVILLQKKIGKGGNNSGSVRRTLLGSCDLNERRIYFTLNIKYKFVADLSSKSTAKDWGCPAEADHCRWTGEMRNASR